MIKIKLTHGTHTVLGTGKTYLAGDVFVGTERMLAGLSGKAEIYDTEGDAESINRGETIDNLRRELDGIGVKYHANAGERRLQEQLDEALKDGDLQA